MKGPLLIAANHPNSFLDAILMDIFFEQPIHSLARGDAFINAWVRAIFRKLRILPVYRIREGAENLRENYNTFDQCLDIFQQDGIVLIFSEGLCVNEWHLRPLKKGTARLAFQSWEKGIPLKVLPVGINYSSFFRIGKNVFINFGEVIEAKDIDLSLSEGTRLRIFNEILEEALKSLVFEIPLKDLSTQKKVLVRDLPFLKKILLFPAALFGVLVHLPLYIPIHGFVYFRYRNTGHKDSVSAGLLLLLYPFYLILVARQADIFLYDNFLTWMAVFVAFPLTARAYILIKPQLDQLWWK